MKSLFAFGLLAGLAVVAPAYADDFYAGKTVNLMVGAAAGSGYDLNARALARYMVNHIPGHPSIVVQNQPGAGSIKLANKLYNAGPFDGLTIGAGFGGMPTAPLLQPQGVSFDALKLNWIGSTNQEIQVGYVWKTAPVQKFTDLLTTTLLVGAQGPGTTQYDLPVLANALFGTHFKVISGYEGTPQVQDALERGETQGVGATAYSTLVALNGRWLKDGSVKIIVQWGNKTIPELAGVPQIIDFAKTDADRMAVKLVLARLIAGRPFFLPPKVPADRVAILRKAFDETMKDPGFIAEEQKMKLDLDPLSGEGVAKVLAEVYATPPDVAARVRKIMAGGGE